ncbi:MAG: STAS domain-containing protein, partial [Actinomycetota bacterium]
TAPTLADRLAAVPASTALGVDLAGTTFISSAGLAVLLATAERLEAASGSLRVVGASETVVRLIELSGLADRLPLADQLGDDD